MQCPRCGLQNLPDITACARCGLAVYPPPPPPPGASGYGTPSGPPSGPPSYPSPQQYPPSGPPPSAPFPPPYEARYGTPAGSPYSTGPVAPYGATAVLPVVPRGGSATATDPSRGLSRLLLLLGALACVGYAIWAMTARRGIFADFADNRSVSLDDAKRSDQVDTVFLIVAGAIAMIALAVWIIRLLAGRASSGGLAVAGFVISALGLACVVVGLVLSGIVGNGGNRVDEGQQAMTATIVTGSGFIAVAVGLLIGCLVIGRKRQPVPAGGSQDMAGAPAGW